MIETVSLNTLQVISSTDKVLPLTGIWNPDITIEAWKWDRTQNVDLSIQSGHANTYVGGRNTNLHEGTSILDWQSGSVDGIHIQQILNVDQQYVPQCNTDQYGWAWETRRLYSDYSLQSIIDPDDAITEASVVRSVAVVDSDCLEATLAITSWKRVDGYNMQHISWQYVDAFTGIISGTSRIDTVSETGIIDWANVDTGYHEFMVSNHEVILNQSASIQVGPIADPASDAEIVGLGEFQHAGNGSSRYLYLEHFPVIGSTVRVWAVLRSTGVATQLDWTQWLNVAAATDTVFTVDEMLGIVEVGGALASPLVLRATVSDSTSTITVFPDEAWSEWPEFGWLTIDGEIISYNSKGHYQFEGCVRGTNSTAASAHTIGAIITGTQQGVAWSSAYDFYVAYTATPMVQYEVDARNVTRTANKAPLLDCSPVHNVLSNRIVQIVSEEQALTSITLTCDANLVGADIYDGVQYGLDSTLVTATALDQNDRPMEDQDLWISITTGTGVLNGESLSIEGMTNTLGELYAVYTCPFNTEGVKYVVQSQSHPTGASTTMVVPGIIANTDPKEIAIFQVLKQDPVVGSVGVPYVIQTAVTGGTESGAVKLKLDARIDDTYLGGLVRVLGTDSIVYTTTIKSIYTIQDGTLKSEVWLTDSIPDTVLTGQTAYLLPRENVEWDPARLNGVDVLVYQWSTDYKHPLTSATGAYGPVRPTSVAANSLTFDVYLPDPNASNDAVNLGAYIVIAPTQITLQAFGRDTISGQLISSNAITIRLSVPPQLTGIEAAVLPIPYGFTLVTESFNIGSIIGLGNFLTVNPRAYGLGVFTGSLEV